MIRAAVGTFILLVGLPGAAQAQSAGTATSRTPSEDVVQAKDAAGRPVGSLPTLPNKGDSPLRFRRVYVPEAELLDRVKRHERYVPMNAEDFEARLLRMQGPLQHAGEPQAGISYATYSAELDSGFRLTGTGAWHIKHQGKKPALVLLSGLALALREPRWAPEDGSSPPAPAKIGATADGEAALYAERSGIVMFDWFLAGSRDQDRPRTYELALPNCAAHRLELTLPADLAPAIEGAIISAPSALGSQRRRWTIDLVGPFSGQLRLLDGGQQKIIKPLAVYRPKMTYELSRHGLQLSAEWQIDVHGDPVKSIAMDMDAELTLLSATSGGSSLEWSETAEMAADGVKRVTLRFAAPLHGTSRLLRLTATAPLKIGASWKLPNVSARDLVWQDGTAALVVAHPLALQRLDLSHCRQTKRESLPAPAAGEAIGIQALSSAAMVTVHVAQREERLELRSGTTIELLGAEARALYVAEITAGQGERFQVSAEISPDWIVDSVQSSPEEMMAQWDRRRGDGSAARLVVQLAKSVNRDRPLRLLVRATRRSAVLGSTLGSEDLRILSFDEVVPLRQLVQLTTTPFYRLELSGADNLVRLDAEHLDSGDAGLLGDDLAGQLFLNDERAGGLQIRLLPERPRFSAALETRVVVSQREIEELHELRVSPESNELDQVIVHLSQTRFADLSWTMKGGGAAVSSRRLTREDQVALGIADGGETWEVRFPAALASPFVLVASRRSQIQDEMPIALPSLLYSTSQQGNLWVELDSEFTPELVERRLKALAIEPAAPGAYQNVLAAYQYDPTEDLLIAKEPALVLKIDRLPEHRRPAWAWHCMVDAWFSPSRSVRYRARFFIENAGRSRVVIGLAPNEFESGAPPAVKIDGAAANEVLWDKESGELEVALPGGRRYCVVEVGWNERTAELGAISTRTLTWPTADVPILGRDTAVWLPGEYVLAGAAHASLVRQTQRPVWRERLFGPLGRPHDHETFEPWLAEDWLRLGGTATANRLALASQADAAFALEPQDVWMNLPPTEAFTGPTVEPGMANNLPGDSWTTYPLEWTASEGEIRLLIVRRQTLIALSVGLFVFAVGIFWRLSDRSAFVQIVALGLVVIIALLLPVVFAPLGAATVLGYVGGKFCRWLFQTPTAGKPEEIAIGGVSATVGSLCILAWMWSSSLAAQEPSRTSSDAAATPIHDVLIPIDDDERVAGDKLFVPEALYRVLVSTADGDPKEYLYLITSAAYEGAERLTWTDEQPSAPQTWRARLTIEVLQSEARILLPLGKNVQLVPDSGRLDGKPLQFGWSDEQESFYFDVSETGTANVEFELRPASGGESAAGGVSFAIPRVPQSNLQLQVADPAHPPQILAIGGTSLEAGSKQLTAQLGPIGQVNIASSGATSRTNSPPQFDSDELIYLKLRPGSALLNARFSIQVRRGAVTEVSVRHDERFLPLPVGGQSLLASSVGVSENETRLRFSQPVTDRAVIYLAFVVKGMSGVGRFEWPGISIAGAASSRRRIGCSVDPSLELVSTPNAAVKALNSAQFAALWGEPEARPLAFEVAAPAVEWSLDIRPRRASLAGNYHAAVELSPNHATLQWNGTIDISGGSRYQLRVMIPPDFSIQQVQVRDEAGVRPSRWALSEGRLLTVFFDAAATGRLHVFARGQLAVDKSNHLTVPLLEVEGITDASSTLTILRRSSVTASIVQQGNLHELDVTESEAVLSEHQNDGDAQGALPRSRLVAALRAKNAKGPVVLVVQKNAPRVEAVQAISLARQGDAWQAALDLTLNISGGVLDAVRVAIPASWSAPFRVEPDVRHEVIEVPGENRRQLLIYPPQPLAGAARFRIEGRLSPIAGQRVRAPDAQVLGAASLAEYFALPLQQDLQSLSWETRGLKPEALPEGLVQDRGGGEIAQTFIRAGDQFLAELRSVEKIADEVQVRLADFAVSWARDGAYYGAATFDIEPAGRSSCRLALAAGSLLVHLSVDGRPLRLAPAGELRWQVPLSGGRLPQRIEIVYRGRLASFIAGSPVIESPKLIGLPVERTLWTISGPVSAGVASAKDTDRVARIELEAARFESIAELIESAAGTLSEVASEETPRWYAAWAGRMMSSRQTLEWLQTLMPDSESDPELIERIEFVDQDQDRLAERLSTHDILNLLWDDPPRGQSSLAAWNASLGRAHSSWHGMFLGEASTVSLTYADYLAGDFASQATSALIAAALLLMAVAAVRYTTAPQWLSNRPRFMVLAAGIFWWLFLWPSAAGWLVVLAAAFLPHLRRLGRRVVRRPARIVPVA